MLHIMLRQNSNPLPSAGRGSLEYESMGQKLSIMYTFEQIIVLVVFRFKRHHL